MGDVGTNMAVGYVRIIGMVKNETEIHRSRCD